MTTNEQSPANSQPGEVRSSEGLGRTAAHTPGPWRDMKDGEIIPLKSIYCERLGFQIGFVNTDRKSVEAQAQANAHLIAAAPDLLAALNAMLTHMGMDEDEWNKPTFEQARAAIAKALGVVSP